MTRAAAPVRRVGRRTAMQMFGWPLLIAVTAIAGLVIGLTGDGTRDLISIVLLCIGPVALLLSARRPD